MQYRNEQDSNEQQQTSRLDKAKNLFRKTVEKITPSPKGPKYAFDNATKGDAADFSRHVDFFVRQRDVEGQAALISESPQPNEALRDVLDVHAPPGKGKEEFRARALANLSGHLPAERMGDVLGAVKEFKNEFSQGRALGGIAAYLSSDELQRAALGVAQSMRDELARAQALAGVAPHLSAELQREAVQDGLRAAQGVKDENYFRSAHADAVAAFDSLGYKHSLKSTDEIKGSVRQSSPDANGEVKRDVDNDLKRHLPASRPESDVAHRFAVKGAHPDAQLLLAESAQDQNNHATHERGNERTKATAAQTKGGFASMEDEVNVAFAKTTRPQRSL